MIIKQKNPLRAFNGRQRVKIEISFRKKKLIGAEKIFKDRLNYSVARYIGKKTVAREQVCKLLNHRGYAAGKSFNFLNIVRVSYIPD